MFLITQNDFPQALVEGKRAIELDPLSLLANIFLGWIYLLINRPNNALAQVKKMIEIEPRYYAIYWLEGSIYLAGGMLEKAVAAYEKSLPVWQNSFKFVVSRLRLRSFGKNGGSLALARRIA